MPYFIKQTNGSPLNGLNLDDSDKPFFTDLDGDGKVDLLVQKASGEFVAYRNTENRYSLFERDFAGLTGRNFGNITSATFADIDGDGDGDAVIRLANGKVQILQNDAGSFFSIGGINTDLVANNNPFQRFSEFENFMANLGLQPAATSPQEAGTPEINEFGRIVASSDFVRDAGWDNQNQYVRKLADVNGDGRIDIIGFGPDRVFTALGQADGSFGQTTVAMQDWAFTIAGTWTSQSQLPRQVADVNGDGYADIVGFGHDRVYTKFGQGDGTFSNHSVVSTSAHYTFLGNWVSQDKYPRLLADVNGDGRSDIVGFARDAVFTSLGQEDGTFATIQRSVNTSRLFYSDGWVSQNQFPRQMADVNGDGRADIVGFGQDQVFVAFGLSNGQFGQSFIASTDFTRAKGWASQNQYPRKVVDVNGDGRADIVGFRDGTAYVALGLNNSTFKAAFEAPELALSKTGDIDLNLNPLGLADVDGDGQVDLIEFGDDAVEVALDLTAEPPAFEPENNQTSGPIIVDASSSFTNNTGWLSQNKYPRQLVDLNNDGRVDIIGFGDDRVFTALGQADGSFGQTTIAMQDRSFTIAGDWTSQHELPRQVADINGDGYADIVGFGHDRVYTRFGQSGGTFSNQYVVSTSNQYTLGRGWINQDRYPRFLADVNGDGRSDIVGFNHGRVTTSLGQASGSFAADQEAYLGGLSYSAGWDSQDHTPRQMADVNGDGRADIVAFGQDQVFIALGQSNGKFAPSTVASEDFTRARGWFVQSQFPRKVIDVNGDGRADIVGLLDGVTYVALSQEDGTFAPATETSEWVFNFDGWLSTNRNPLDLGDVNGDGSPDLVEFRDDRVQVTLGHQDEVTYVDLDEDGDYDKLVNRGDDATFDIYLNEDGNYVFNETVEIAPDNEAIATEETDSTNAESTNAESTNAASTTEPQDNSEEQPQLPTQDTALAPSFGDLDGDGDLDALVGHSNGNVDIYLNQAGESVLIGTLENVGEGVKPALGDVDNDGDLDVLVGDVSGGLHYYQNQTSQGNGFVRQTGKKNPFQYISVGYDAQPSIADIDGDGDPDLVVTDGEGGIHHYDSFTATPSLSRLHSTFDHFGHIKQYDFIEKPNDDLTVLRTGKLYRYESVYSDAKTAQSLWGSQDRNPRQLADVNGDGRADIIGFGPDRVVVALANDSGSFEKPIGTLSDFGINVGGGWSSQNLYPRQLADVNGDGRADIVGFGDDGTVVALGQEDGTFGGRIVAHAGYNRAGEWNSQNQLPRRLADLNGDGRADIVGFGHGGVYTSLGQADGTFADGYVHAHAGFGFTPGWTDENLIPHLVGDVNGDGYGDIVGIRHDHIVVALGNGDGAFSENLSISSDNRFTVAGGWESQDKHPRHLADMNGDGLDDLVGFHDTGIEVALGRNNGTFGPSTILRSDHFINNLGWNSQDRSPRQLGDINGDGLADIVGFDSTNLGILGNFASIRSGLTDGDINPYGTTVIQLNNSVRPDPAADLSFESVFSSNGTSMWHDGDAFKVDWNFKEWAGLASNQPIVHESFTLPSKSLGGFAKVSLGKAETLIDFDANLNIDSGSVDTKLPLTTWFGMPEEKPSLGENITLKTGAFLSEDAAFDTIFPFISADLMAEVFLKTEAPKISLRVPLVNDPALEFSDLAIDHTKAFRLRFDSRDSFSSEDLEIHLDMGTKSDVEQTDENGKPQGNKDTKSEKRGKKKGKKKGGGNGELDFSDYVTFEMQGMDKMNLTSSRESDFTLEAFGKQNFFEARVDIDNILAESKYFPQLEFREEIDFKLGDAFAEINLFDADLVTNFSVAQAFKLEVESIDGLLTFEDGSTQNFTVGEDINFLIEERVINTNANDNKNAKIKVTVTPNVVLRNTTSMVYDIGLELAALSGSAGFDVGISTPFGSLSYDDSTSFGPRWSHRETLFSDSVYTYDNTFKLDSFGSLSYDLIIPV